MLSGMEKSVLGIWVAHGEGLAYFPDKKMFRECEHGLAPVRYVDDDSKITEAYPFNPNGSPAGIAGLCSPDGRHLAMMPHPERAVLNLAVGLDARGAQKDPSTLRPGSGCSRMPGSGVRETSKQFYDRERRQMQESR